MNIYIIVEGAETETKVYPEWLRLLVPDMSRIDDAWKVKQTSTESTKRRRCSMTI